MICFFIIKEIDICNYADDNTRHTSDLHLDELMKRLECAVEKALDWFKNNGMILNSSKCHLLVCGNKSECMIGQVGESKVIETHRVKLLAISIDSKLDFESHLHMICKKVSKKLNVLSRQCSILPFHRRKSLMNAFFTSQFSHGPLVWMFHSRGFNTKINNLHHRALRMIYQDDISSFEELLVKNGSITIHQRNLRALVIEMYKVSKNITPPFMENIFSRNRNLGSGNVSSNTRSKSLFYNPENPKKVKTGLQTVRCIGHKIWEMVPNDIKDAASVNIFKNKMKNFTFEKCPCRLCLKCVPNLGII